MFDSDYSIAWTVYLGGALGGTLVWWRLTRWMWRFLWEPLWLLVAVIAFTPTLVDPGRDLYAPAVAITAMDLLFDMGNNAWRAVSDLVFYLLIALGLYIPVALLRWFIESRGSQDPDTTGEEAQKAVEESSGYSYEPFDREAGHSRPTYETKYSSSRYPDQGRRY